MFPKTEQDVKKAVECFYEIHGFPQCLWAIDGTHVFVKQPRKNPMDCINRKKPKTDTRSMYRARVTPNTVLQM